RTAPNIHSAVLDLVLVPPWKTYRRSKSPTRRIRGGPRPRPIHKSAGKTAAEGSSVENPAEGIATLLRSGPRKWIILSYLSESTAPSGRAGEQQFSHFDFFN